MIKNSISAILVLVFVLPCSVLSAQVQVRDEPVHKPVFINKYFRLLDVHLPAGDTTQFHIHSTPSVFVHHSSTTVASQEAGKPWVTETTVAGKAWFRSFRPDSLVHRVATTGPIPLHVNDAELLASYNPATFKGTMPYEVLFNNDTVAAYRLSNADMNGQEISGRGPMLAILIKGEGVAYHDIPSDERRNLLPGQYKYISPGLIFTLQAKGATTAELVLFEIK